MVNATPVYIAESHHHVLAAWAQLRRRLADAARLLTFDYHTDTKPAFLAYGTANRKLDSPSWSDIADERVAEIDFQVEHTLTTAINNLRYDEHIDAAIRSGIIDIAFVAPYADSGHIESNEQIALDASREQTFITDQGEEIAFRSPKRELATPPFSYSLPESRIAILPRTRLNEDFRGDDLDRLYRDSAIETDSLNQRLFLIEQITTSADIPGLFDRPFILDIDLDYFNTRKSISPRDSSTFYRLIRGAPIITIARERSCVEQCQIDEREGLDSDFLERALLEHISRALSSVGGSTEMTLLS